jgi:hypothetical protein
MEFVLVVMTVLPHRTQGCQLGGGRLLTNIMKTMKDGIPGGRSGAVVLSAGHSRLR